MDNRRKSATQNQYAHTFDNSNKKDNGGGAGNCQLLLYLRKSVALPCASENAFGQNHLCPQEIGAELEMHQPRQREQQERWVRKLYSMCAHSTRAESQTK